MRWREFAFPVVLASIGIALACHPMLSSGFALMEVDPADTRHLNYVLEHGWRWLSSFGGVSLWNPAFFFPETNVAAFTEVMIGMVPFYGIWRVFGFEPDTSFQLWMITVLILNYVTGWLFFRRALSFNAFPAAAGAFILSFGSVRLASLNHQHLLPFMFTIIALHALARLFQQPTRPRFWIVTFFAGVVLQLYSGITLGWFLGFVLGISLLWALIFSETRVQILQVARANSLTILLSTIAAACSLAILIGPYRSASHSAGARTFQEASDMIPQFQSWFYLGPHSWLYSWMTQLKIFTQLHVEGEHRIGLGLVTTALMLWTLWINRRHQWIKVMALTILTVVLCATMYRGNVSPWQLVMATIPGANGIRAVARIGMLMLIPAAVTLAMFAQRERFGRGVTFGIVAFCLLEQAQRVADTYSKADLRADVMTVANAIPAGCTAFFYAPMNVPKYDEKTQLDAMWAQLQTGIPTVNGYSSHFPRDWNLFEHGITNVSVDEPRLREKLSQWAQLRDVPVESICWLPVEGRR